MAGISHTRDRMAFFPSPEYSLRAFELMPLMGHPQHQFITVSASAPSLYLYSVRCRWSVFKSAVRIHVSACRHFWGNADDDDGFHPVSRLIGPIRCHADRLLHRSDKISSVGEETAKPFC
jgi:hypothetical protein